jgi:hypothetical protein
MATSYKLLKRKGAHDIADVLVMRIINLHWLTKITLLPLDEA